MSGKDSLGWTGVKLIAVGLGALLLAIVATPLLKLTGILLIGGGMLFGVASLMRWFVPFKSRG